MAKKKKKTDGEKNYYSEKQDNHFSRNSILLKTAAFCLSVAGASYFLLTNESLTKKFENFDRSFYRSRNSVLQPFQEGSRGLVAFIPIMALNGAVFLAWRIPNPIIQRTLHTYFLNSPYSSVFANIGAAFSHQGGMHMLFNSFALFTFLQDKNDMTIPQIWLFYLGTGAMCSWASKTFFMLRGQNFQSLGASGALLGIIGLEAVNHPDQRLALIFLPFWSFTIKNGVLGMLMFDGAGLLKTMIQGAGFFSIDHAGHLGGLLAGLFFASNQPKKSLQRRIQNR